MMRRIKSISIFLVLILCINRANAIDTLFLNVDSIVISAETTIVPTNEEKNWGMQVLKNLNIEGLSSYKKAWVIEKYIAETFKYRIKSPRTIQGFIDSNGGNCLSHSIMGLFLLRLAGIPAKLCYEYHVRNFFIIDQWRAYFKKASFFGAAFNSHVWLLFYDGNEWQPYDSALDITGFDEFFRVRTRTQRWPYFLSFNPKRMTGAPFIVQQETGQGFTNMEVITSKIWNRNYQWNNAKVSKEEWLLFVNEFRGMKTSDFIFPIGKEIQKKMKKMSRKWF